MAASSRWTSFSQFARGGRGWPAAGARLLQAASEPPASLRSYAVLDR
ncbi:hypothetical protein HMPREF1868_01195 [Olsenella sp. DNF00959]|nr:hypothetical protein HMPREF1868_01195 [Olsenella sp. DNF00959]